MPQLCTENLRSAVCVSYLLVQLLPVLFLRCHKHLKSQPLSQTRCLVTGAPQVTGGPQAEPRIIGLPGRKLSVNTST